MHYKASDLLNYLFDNNYLERTDWINNSNSYDKTFYRIEPSGSIIYNIFKNDSISKGDFLISKNDFDSKIRFYKLGKKELKKFYHNIDKFLI